MATKQSLSTTKKTGKTKKALTAKTGAKNLKVSKKAAAKTSSFSDRLSSFLSQISSSTNSLQTKETAKTKSENNQKVSKIKGKRFLLPLLGLLVLLSLVYLASKFLVVAWVDNKPISRFDYYNQLDQKYGHDLREEMITEALVQSEAQQKGLSASNQEIDQQIQTIATQQGGQDKLNQVLQAQGITQPELRDLVKLQILRQKLFGTGVTVSDDEVNSYYDQNKDSILGSQTNPDASTEASLKESVRQQLLQQKVDATFSAWLQSTINSNRVVRVQ